VAIEQVEQAVAGYRALVQACLGSPCGFNKETVLMNLLEQGESAPLGTYQV